MKRKLVLALLTLSILAVSAVGCKDKDKEKPENAPEATTSMIDNVKEEANIIAEEIAEEVVEEEVPDTGDVVPEGMYRSEINGTFTNLDIRMQRPVAVMVDNEKNALPHFGVNDADVVYEMMNSTANDRITRLMCVVKDWKNIKQLGSIRSTRSTNIPVAAEWNAVLIHDGGPFYIDAWLAKDYAAHFSGGFGRVNNGKAREFTEYVLTGELEKRFASSKYSTEYDKYYSPGMDDDGNPVNHFKFASSERTLNDVNGSKPASEIVLPFKHTNSTLKYNESTKTYDYYLYGNAHKDGSSGEVLTFKNVLLQDCTFAKLDANGYMVYNVIDQDKRDGYYITNGTAMPVYWIKGSDTDVTRFYDKDGNEIEINPGKTYISLVPSDTWKDVSIK